MFDWTTRVIVALCVIVLLSALTMPAGIGGGILFVPILRLVGGLIQSEASALSQVLIAGASVGSVSFQVLWQYRHPKEHLLAQPYFVVVAMPGLLSGSLVGVFMNNLLPSFISLLLLVLLCVVSSFVIFRKGIDCYRKENEILLLQKNSLPSPDLSHPLDAATEGGPPPLQPITDLEREISMVSIAAGLNVPHTPREPLAEPAQSYLYDATVVIPNTTSVVSISSLRRLNRVTSGSNYRSSSTDTVTSPVNQESAENSQSVEWLNQRKASNRMRVITRTVRSFIVFVTFYWLVLVVFTVLRGSRSNPSFAGIEPCGSAYWVVTGIQAFMGVVFAFIVAPREFRIIVGTFCAGLVATITGASGGIMLNPMFLNIGLDPQQVAATSTIIMLVMASCSALEFLIAGKIEPILAITAIATLGGAVVGMTGVSWIVKKSGRQSILVFLLGSLVVAGGTMLIYIGISDVVNTYKDGGNPFELGQLC